MILAVVLGVAGAGGGGTPAAFGVADPFYLDLLRDGIQSYDRADYAAAAKRLRLACFGMLDDPEALAPCLTRLGLAQAAAGDADAFRETFRRIVEVEDRFGAYAKADLPPAVRAAFEQRVLAAVPAGTLEAIAAWRPLLNRKLESQIAGLPPRERRRQLEERLGKEPKSVPWNVLLAELDVEEGQTAPALARAEATVALAPQDPWALCVRGLARAAANRCREALTDLEPCALASPSAAGAAAAVGAPPAGGSRSSRGSASPGGGSPGGDESARTGAGDVRYAAALLGCRVELGQWRQAEEQVKALPSGFRQDRKVAALIQQVAKHPSGAGTPPARGPGATAPAAAPSVPGSAATATAGAAGAGGKGPAAAAGSGSQAGTKAPASAANSAKPAAAASTAGAAGSAGSNARPGSPSGGAAAGSAPGPAAAPPAATGGASAEAPRAPAGTTAVPLAASRPAAPMSAAERDAMARVEKLLTATAIPDLREALRLGRQLADAHPDSREAQYLAGEAAYRNSRWTEAATYFRRGGPAGDDHPELLFYMAVAFYEVGDRPAAATALRRSLPNLQKTPFVESYIKRILGP